MDAVIEKATDAFNYIYGGKGKVTLVSKRTGSRYTYKFKTARKDGPRDPLIFVSLLTGSDNQTNYSYIGYINPISVGLNAGKKGQPTAVAYKALNWAINKLAADEMPEDLEVWHSGTCGKCGRELTVPQSIASGLGPVCAGRV